VLYLKSLGIHHFLVLYVRDIYGNEFNWDLKVAAQEHDLHVISIPYQDGVPGSIDRAIHELKHHDHRYIFAVITSSANVLKYIVRQALIINLSKEPILFKARTLSLITNVAVCRHFVHINWSYVLLDTLKLIISMDITNGKPSIMVQFRNRLRHVEDSALGPVCYMSNSPETHLPRDRMKETYTLQKKEIHA
jgi:hypothetical protein